MKYAIKKEILGSKRHIVVDLDNETYETSDSIDEIVWSLGNMGGKDIGYLYKSVTGKEISIFDKRHYSAWRALNASITPKWRYLIKKKEYTNSIRDAIKRINDVFFKIDIEYYDKFFIESNYILDNLRSAKIDLKMLESLTTGENIGNHKSSLERFKPESHDILSAPDYNRFMSVTGRPVITSGPNILTLRKDFRKIIIPKNPGGKIVQVDIKSLEPRIGLILAGYSPENDVYQFVSNSLGIHGLKRDDLKIAILGCLYGMSVHTLRKRLTSSKGASNILKSINKLFKLESLKDVMKKDISNTGYIKNYFGRHIKTESPNINHYLQSTGADVSLSCFSNLIKKIDINHIRPIYVIHDAIVFDVDSGYYENLVSIVENGLSCENINENFPVTVEEF